MRDMNEPISHNSSSRTKFKQRIAGGAVLLIVLAIFLPFIFNHAHNAAVNLEISPAANLSATETAPAPQAAPAPTAAQEAPAAPATATVSESQPVASTTASSSTPAAMTVEQSESNNTLNLPDNTVMLPPPQAATPTPATAEAPAAATTDNQAPATAAVPAPAPTLAPAKSNIETKTAPAAPIKKTAPIAGRWILQVGSFGNIENAQQLAAQLRARGYHAYIQHSANERVRVYVGPLTSLQQVQKIQEQIQSQFKVSALVHEVRH